MVVAVVYGIVHHGVKGGLYDQGDDEEFPFGPSRRFADGFDDEVGHVVGGEANFEAVWSYTFVVVVEVGRNDASAPYAVVLLTIRVYAGDPS